MKLIGYYIEFKKFNEFFQRNCTERSKVRGENVAKVSNTTRREKSVCREIFTMRIWTIVICVCECFVVVLIASPII